MDWLWVDLLVDYKIPGMSVIFLSNETMVIFLIFIVISEQWSDALYQILPNFTNYNSCKLSYLFLRVQ
jgi:hypothetical protein